MNSELDSEYPWFVRFSNGDIDFCGIPDRLLRHPELQRRGIVPTDVLKAVRNLSYSAYPGS